MSKREQVLLTGGTGFFGKSLLAKWECQSHPNRELVILSRDPEHFLSHNPAFSKIAQVRFIKGDIRSFSVPRGERFDLVIHAATPVDATHEAINDEKQFEVIADGTEHLLKIASRSGVKRLLLVSSGAVYGSQPPELERITEDFPINPLTAYGRGKAVAEQCCLKSGIPTVIARCFAFVGSYLPLGAHFAIGNFLKNALMRQPISVRGDGRPFRSYLHSDDLVRWLWTLLDRGVPGRAYNVGSDDAVSIAELANMVAKLVDPPLPVEILSPPATGRSPRYVPNISRAREELGLQVEVELQPALQRTFEFHQKRGIL